METLWVLKEIASLIYKFSTPFSFLTDKVVHGININTPASERRKTQREGSLIEELEYRYSEFNGLFLYSRNRNGCLKCECAYMFHSFLKLSCSMEYLGLRALLSVMFACLSITPIGLLKGLIFTHPQIHWALLEVLLWAHSECPVILSWLQQ